MIRVKVIKIDSKIAASDLPICEKDKKEEITKLEKLIAQIGYDSIKDIIVSAPGAPCSFYTIFYEDGQP